MSWLAAALALAAAAYYALALAAAARWSSFRLRTSRQAKTPAPIYPAVSILKPIQGRDAGFYEALRSHASQDYPEFEILFGLSDPGDPAAADIARLQAEFPRVAISCLQVSTQAPNTKAGVLAELARRARHPMLLVNDGDIAVEPGYLRAVVAPLADPLVGLVTCLYRAVGGSPATRAEALGIATEFAPSVLVARLLGVAEFALGSTMVFRAETLGRIGGFEGDRQTSWPTITNWAAAFTNWATASSLRRWWWRRTWAQVPGATCGCTSCGGRGRCGCRALRATTGTL